MAMARVTVLMSVFNRENYLPESIESILGQAYVDYEFIIIDDASTDDTVTILNSYHDPRIIIMRNKDNIGLTRSLNRGLQFANGNYIARMDADDTSLPERLAHQVRFLDCNRNYGLVGTSFEVYDEMTRRRKICPVPINDSRLRKYLLLNNPFCHGSVMFRKECLGKIGAYNPNLTYAQDYDFWIRISDHYKVAILPEILYRWRKDPGGISFKNREDQKHFSRSINVRAWESHLRELKSGRLQSFSDPEEETLSLPDHLKSVRDREFSSVLSWLSWEYLKRGLRSQAFRNLRQSLRLNLFNLHSYFFLGTCALSSRQLTRIRKIKRTLLGGKTD